MYLLTDTLPSSERRPEQAHSYIFFALYLLNHRQ
jgi:hypothetical protein